MPAIDGGYNFRPLTGDNMLKQIIGATLVAITAAANANAETAQQEIDRIITEICTMQGTAAFAVMGARQSGAPMSSALKAARKASDPIFVEITKGAWEYQRWASPGMKHEESINYRDHWEAKCYKKYENE